LWLTDDPIAVPGLKQVLINLGASIPAGIEPYDRFFEVVSTQAEDRQLGRSRWREYEARGWTVKAHVAQAES
jgi:DNA polymerase III subunit chi